MSATHPKPSEKGPQTPRSAGHQASAGSTDPASSAPAEVDSQDAIDPELQDDLGAEFELRGDMLEAELEALRVESAEHRDRAMRAQAEFDNFRKRITREREEERRRASERLVTELLPALDNLERAIAHTTAGGDLKHLLAGVEAVYAQIVGVLGKEGVTVIDPTGEHFDPMTQQAVSQREDDSVPDGTVVEVFQKGYSLGERVIRSAMVVVSTGGPQAQE
jgi:molecular chaperone GrpE